MIPRLGEPIDPRQSYRLRPGVYAILPRNGALLLTLQSADDVELQLPGGGVDAGESPLRALHREVMEETGWTIARPRRLGAYRRFVFMPDYGFWAEKLCTIYVATPARQVSKPLETSHTAVWDSPASASAALTSPGDRRFVAQHYGLTGII